MTLEERRNEKARPIANRMKLGWLRANGFVSQETFEDLVELSIIRFKGQLADFLDYANVIYQQRVLDKEAGKANRDY